MPMAHASRIKVLLDEDCSTLSAEYGLTMDELDEFNQNTWGWSGCGLLFQDTVMCLSTGTPPFPDPIPNAVCGPQKFGSEPPTDGTDLADMKPCPLDACCNIWGQCSITPDFCVYTNTGAPGPQRRVPTGASPTAAWML